MAKSGVKKFNFARWCDEWALAAKGIVLATKTPKFWVAFGLSFLFFGLLMNLLSGGFAKFELMGALGFPGSLRIIGDAFLGIFGVNLLFTDWLPVFTLATLQGALIGLIVLLWSKKRNLNAANVEKAGIITGLIALGAGCPTCGTTLLTPLLGALFSTSSFALVGIVSGVVTALAILVALLSLKRLGLETYVTIINEQYLLRKRSHHGTKN